MMKFKDHESFERYLKIEVEVIREFRTSENARAGSDLGQFAALSWIKMHAKEFRDSYILQHPEDFIDG